MKNFSLFSSSIQQVFAVVVLSQASKAIRGLAYLTIE
jgi:hypothetical protein